MLRTASVKQQLRLLNRMSKYNKKLIQVFFSILFHSPFLSLFIYVHLCFASFTPEEKTDKNEETEKLYGSSSGKKPIFYRMKAFCYLYRLSVERTSIFHCYSLNCKYVLAHGIQIHFRLNCVSITAHMNRWIHPGTTLGTYLVLYTGALIRWRGKLRMKTHHSERTQRPDRPDAV